MRERIAKKLWVDIQQVNPFRTSELPTIGTFHSVSAFFLRMFIDRIGYSKDFIIYDEDDKLRLMKDIMKELSIDDKEFNPRAILGTISKAKWDGYFAEWYSQLVDSYFTSIVSDVYKKYSMKLREQNAVDFDDLLLLMKEILTIDEVVNYFHERYGYFMVDEYQDTNSLQYDIIQILARNSRNLCVVGDDWQGIYSWRGADIKNILSFKKDYPEAKVINLEENYRSTGNIINAANALIKNNTNQMDKTLWTKKESWEKIHLIEWVDEKHESDVVANIIKEDEHYKDWAILYRTNAQSRVIEEWLIKKNIPYRVFGWLKFYERKEIKDILSYIRLVFNHADLISLKRIINVPGRKIGDKTIENLLEFLEQNHYSILDIADNRDLLVGFTPQAREALTRFFSLYKSFRDDASTKTVREVMEAIVLRTGYLEYLKAEYSEDDAESKTENIDEFLNMASRYDGLIYPENFAMFLEDIALITDQDRENDNSSEVVSLMTIHLAKWLEFPKVVIMGAEEGVFPHSRSLMETSAIEEERRLMYVAITRAKERLYISRAHERYSFWNYSTNPKSRFLKEIPEEYLHTDTSNRGSAFSIFGTAGGLSWLWDAVNAFKKDTSPLYTPPSKTGKKHNASEFATGDRIKHPQYGAGTIVSMNDTIADIAFSGMGIKKMNIEIAPIEKI